MRNWREEGKRFGNCYLIKYFLVCIIYVEWRRRVQYEFRGKCAERKQTHQRHEGENQCYSCLIVIVPTTKVGWILYCGIRYAILLVLHNLY